MVGPCLLPPTSGPVAQIGGENVSTPSWQLPRIYSDGSKFVVVLDNTHAPNDELYEHLENVDFEQTQCVPAKGPQW